MFSSDLDQNLFPSDLLPVWARNISFQREKKLGKIRNNKLYGFILNFTALMHKRIPEKVTEFNAVSHIVHGHKNIKNSIHNIHII